MDKIYLDMNIYNRPFDEQSQWRIKFESLASQFIFQAIQDKRIKLVWSFILSYENHLNPFPDRIRAVEFFAKLAEELIVPDKQIKLLAENYEKIGIKNIDALHLACAEYHYFITCDDKFLKKAKKLNLRLQPYNPVDYVNKVLHHAS
jgi:hypothetical protein